MFRREFLKRGLAAVGIGLFGDAGGGLTQLARTAMRVPPGAGASRPFLPLPQNPPSTILAGLPFAAGFLGDDFADPASIPFHSSWQGAPPAPTEDVDVAIVGGGLSGLTTAYLLRQHRPVVFDLRSRFGGNAQGETWRGTRSSLGSAYVITPDPGTFLHSLYHQLGLHTVKRESFPPDPVELGGQIHQGFWEGAGMSPDEQAAFASYANVVTFMAETAYPEIPLPSDPAAAAAVRQLDALTFRQDLEARMGMPLTPLLAAGVQAYFYTSFGAGIDEISAASGWNFVAAEEFGRWIFPGGNAWMASVLWDKIRHVEQAHPASAPMLRAGCRVVDVRVVADRVHVTWIEPDGITTRALRARYVVMAGSKHVCKHVIHDLAALDPEKHAAMQRIAMAAYVVANVLLDVPASDAGYDVFLVRDASFPMTPLAFSQAPRPVDALDGNWASSPGLQRSVVSLYWPLPWSGARFTLISATSHKDYAEALAPHLLAALDTIGIPHAAIRQVRLSRWGHALPLAQPGIIADGVPEQLLRPFQDRVFFANQDDWALPAVENSLLDAKTVADGIKALL